jgi:hypothetical protein
MSKMFPLRGKLWLIGLGLVACSGSAPRPAVQPPAVARASAPSIARSRSAKSPSIQPLPVTLAEQDERDRVFVENALRAVASYEAFIAHAGGQAEYAPAVQRSREQIADLLDEIEFVRAGQRQRAAE